MKYIPQIIELADGTKCVYLEDFRRECDEAREAIRALAEHGESEIQRITKERDEARDESLEQARLLGISGEWGCKLIAERDELQEKYDTLAVENMLEVHKICNQRDAAIDALMKMEDIFIDGDDTYEDWKSMGQIARTFFEKTHE
jgi:flagellar motility protein MotE (MotC chaperone)